MIIKHSRYQPANYTAEDLGILEGYAYTIKNKATENEKESFIITGVGGVVNYINITIDTWRKEIPNMLDSDIINIAKQHIFITVDNQEIPLSEIAVIDNDGLASPPNDVPPN